MRVLGFILGVIWSVVGLAAEQRCDLSCVLHNHSVPHCGSAQILDRQRWRERDARRGWKLLHQPGDGKEMEAWTQDAGPKKGSASGLIYLFLISYTE